MLSFIKMVHCAKLLLLKVDFFFLLDQNIALIFDFVKKNSHFLIVFLSLSF